MLQNRFSVKSNNIPFVQQIYPMLTMTINWMLMLISNGDDFFHDSQLSFYINYFISVLKWAHLHTFFILT